MSSRRSISLIVAVAIGALSACNWTVGECWRRGERGEGSEGVGAGFGEGRSDGAGAGDFGDAPGDDEPLQCNKTDDSPKKEESPQERSNSPQDPCPGVGDIAGDGATFLSCSDACSSKCPPGMASFTYVDFGPSDFPFVTIVEDGGTDKGGGYQQASANLKFEHKVVPGGTTTWYCAITIRMPLRTEEMGRVDAARAAILSEEITEDVANRLDYKLPPGIFCKQFADKVKARFRFKYPRLGASVTNP